MLPRRYWSLIRNRNLLLVTLVFLIVGILNMYDMFQSPNIPLDVKMLQGPITKPQSKDIVHELVDVAPLPDDKPGFMKPPENKTKQVDLDEVYKKRRDLVLKVCKQMGVRKQSMAAWAAQMRKLKPLNISICPVLQSSGTWQKVLEIWLRSQPTIRPSLVINQNRYENSLYKYNLNSPINIGAFKKVLSHSLKVLFTRDPYSQLFELYVNNILMPVKESLGVRQRIIQMTGQKLSRSNLQCAHNISFRDFFHFFLYHKDQLPIAPVWAQCDACGIDFDIIGKEDTLVQDIKYVYNRIKAKTASPSEIEDFGQEFDFHRIHTYITTAIKSRFDVTCMSPHAIYKRLWRQLQIWGYISKDIEYPFSRSNSTMLDEVSLSNAVLKAYHSSKPGSTVNRAEAMSQAYIDISSRELHQVRSWFEQDFFMFGYQDRPALLFFKQGPKSDFKYYDIVPLNE